MESEDSSFINVLDNKISSANLNMNQGEIGLSLAQGKANEVLIQFENLSKNLEKETSLA